jgi:ribulose kinase
LKLKSAKRIAASAVMTAALGAAMFVAVPQAYADDHSKCQHAIEKAEARLDDAVRKHGERSHEAEDRRKDLNAERERCYNEYHGWWDGHEKKWHEDHDWH